LPLKSKTRRFPRIVLVALLIRWRCGALAASTAAITGVLLLDIPVESPLAKADLRKNDVILSVNDAKTTDTAALLRQAPELTAGNALKLRVSRDQKEIVIPLFP
jgi:S1-C subfamily serine protease